MPQGATSGEVLKEGGGDVEQLQAGSGFLLSCLRFAAAHQRGPVVSISVAAHYGDPSS